MYASFMKIIFYIIVILLSFTNCSLRDVKGHHGVHFLDKKEKKLIVNISNKNDVFKILGPPIIQSSFNNDLYVYIERKTVSTSLKSLGRKKVLTNNVLLLEIDNRGLLASKKFIDINKMNKINFEEKFTKEEYSKKKFIYKLLSSLRSKINDPLGKKRIKANQQ